MAGPLLDQLSLRSRLAGRALVRQIWAQLFFLRCQSAPGQLRLLIPARVRMSPFGGTAGVGRTSFTIHGTRLSLRSPFQCPVMARCPERCGEKQASLF